MMNEIQVLHTIQKCIIKYNLFLDYSVITENAYSNKENEQLDSIKIKIKKSQFDSQLQINLSKNGILCQDNCAQLKHIIQKIFSQGDQCNLKIKIDMKKILEAGGIHYYFEKQIDLLNKFFKIENLSLNFTKESFNTQCVGIISKSLKQIQNIESFQLQSEINLDYISMLLFPSSNLKQIKLELNDPDPQNLFNKLLDMKSLVFLDISLHNCDILVQEELIKFVNKTKIQQISIYLDFKEQFLLKKDQFYNSLSRFVKQLNTRKIKLINYHINLSQLEDSGLKQDILQELNTGFIKDSLTKLTLIFILEAQIKTLLISFLYKLSSLLLNLENLDRLVLKFNIENKYQDILQKCLNQSLWRLKEFAFEDTCTKNQKLILEIEQEENCRLLKIQGVKLKNSLYKLKYLTIYDQKNTQIQNDLNKILKLDPQNGQQFYLFSKRKLIQQIYAIKVNINFKRKEIFEQLMLLLIA
ncbi:hypothetical protein ABPG72_004230 [Tetrahymena utriculariae]